MGMADSIDLTPSLEPGIYPSSIGLAFTTTSTDIESIACAVDTRPSIGKYLAKDEYGNPYIAVVEDGLGRCYFDGGFPKFYNASFNQSWNKFSDLADTFKLLHNALNWVHNPSKAKKLLVICDTTMYSYYSMNSNPPCFGISIPRTASIAGFTCDVTSYTGSLIDIPSSVLDNYSCCLIMSSNVPPGTMLTQNTIDGLVAFREASNGLIIITDHDVFQPTANSISNRFGVTFSGFVDRNAGSPAYSIATIKAKYGDHPLWNGLTNAVPAGYSEGNVSLTVSPNYTLGTSIPVTSGYHIVYALIKAKDGSISLRQFSYGIGVADPVTWSSSTDRTIKNSFDVNCFHVDRLNDVDVYGLIKYNGRVIGTFSNTSATAFNTSYYFVSTIALEVGNNTIDISVLLPVAYTHHKTIIRDKLNRRVSVSKEAIGFCIDEASDGMNRLKLPKKLDAVKAVIGIPRRHKLTKYIDEVLNYNDRTGTIRTPRKLVVLGDSIGQSYPINCAETPGTLAHVPEDRRAWSAKSAVATGHTIIDKGIYGDTTQGMAARFSRDVTPNIPEYVIIVAGATNLLQGNSIADVTTGLQNLINLTRNIGATPILTNYMNVYDTVANAAHPGISTALVALNTATTGLASSNGLLCINWYGCLTHTDYTPDGIHPNAAGYDKMARVAVVVLNNI